MVVKGQQQGCQASQRALGTRDDADMDMDISVEKTKVLHVRRQDNVSATTSEEARKIYKYV